MKRLASFLMIGVLLTSFTWAQASIPDTRENSKTETLVKVKAVKMEKQMDFQFQITAIRNEVVLQETILVNQSELFSHREKDLYKEKLLIPVKPETFNYRKARDGI